MSTTVPDKLRPALVPMDMGTRPPLGSEMMIPPPRPGPFYDAVYQFREDLLLHYFDNYTIPRAPDVTIPYPSPGLGADTLAELQRLIKSSGSSDINSFAVAIGRPILEFTPDRSFDLVERWPMSIIFYTGDRELARYRATLCVNGNINIEVDTTANRFRLVINHFTFGLRIENSDTMMMKDIFEANRSAFETVFARPETSPLYLTSRLSPFRSLRPGEVVRDIRNARDWRIDLAKVSEPSGRRAIACGLVLTPGADLAHASSLRYNLGDRNFSYYVAESLIRPALFIVWNRADTPKTSRDTRVFLDVTTTDGEVIPTQATMNITLNRLSNVDLYLIDSMTPDVIRLVADCALSVERMRERGGDRREIELTDEMRNGMMDYAISITPFHSPSVDPDATPGRRLVSEITRRCLNLVCVPFIQEEASISDVRGSVSASVHHMSFAGNLNWGRGSD